MLASISTMTILPLPVAILTMVDAAYGRASSLNWAVPIVWPLSENG